MNIEPRKIKTIYRAELIILLGIAIGFLVYSAFVRGIIADEREHIYAAFMIYHGFEPYCDFFEHHHPLLWYMFSPLMVIFHNSEYIWYAVRGFSLLLLVADCFFIVKICQLISKNLYYPLWAVLFFLVGKGIVLNGADFRPDNLMMMFLLAGIYYWLGFIWYGWQSALNLAFMLFFLGLMALQKALIILLPIAGVCLFLLSRKELSWQAIGKAMILPLMWAVVYVIYLYYTGALKDYFELNWLLNLRQKFTFREIIWDSPYCWVALFGAMGGVLFSRNRLFQLISALCLMIFCLLQFVFYTPWLQYWLPVYPFFALVTAYWVVQFKDTLWGFIILNGLAIGIFSQVSEWYRGIFSGAPLSHFVYLSRNVLDITDKDDIIIGNFWTVGGLRFEATGYYWFGRSYIAQLDYRLFHRREWVDIEKLIKARRPKVIVDDVQRFCITDNNETAKCDYRKFVSDDKFLEENYNYHGALYLRKY